MKSVAILSICASTLATTALAFAPPSAVLSTTVQNVAPRRLQHIKMVDDDEVSGCQWVMVESLIVTMFCVQRSHACSCASLVDLQI